MARNRVHRIDQLSDACVQCGQLMDDIIEGKWTRRCPVLEGDNILAITHLIFRKLIAERADQEGKPTPSMDDLSTNNGGKQR